MVLIVALIGFGIMSLAHVAPARFVLDALEGQPAVWHMSRQAPPTVYLTFDDGPNPVTTPALLDVLAREDVPATFFLIDEHVTDETAPLVRRMFAEGHAVALHSSDRSYMLESPEELANTLEANAAHIEHVGGEWPCHAFRPHAGWRGGQMYLGLRRAGYTLIGWGWMRWDWNWFRKRTPESIAKRMSRASAGDIIVIHDGNAADPRKDQRQAVEAAARIIPTLRARGLSFGRVCENQGTSQTAR